jgi:hypothetical protein
MKWQKGQSGNPGGRKKNDARERLEKALKKEAEARGIDFLEHIAKTAFEDTVMAKEVLKKLIPDLKAVEGRLSLKSEGFRLVIERPDSIAQG